MAMKEQINVDQNPGANSLYEIHNEANETLDIYDPRDDPNRYRNQRLSAVSNNAYAGIVYNINTQSLLATRLNSSEGNIIAKVVPYSQVYLDIGNFSPAKNVSMFKDTATSSDPAYQSVIIDAETQNLLLSSGINQINGVQIPSNPRAPLNTRLVKQNSRIDNGAVFTKINPSDPEYPDVQQNVPGQQTPQADNNLMVTTRVPDAFNYWHSANPSSIPIEQRGHAQYQVPLDDNFEAELARARYLSGVMPYLDDHQSKEFDHFTYWRYKQTNPNNAFRGAYIHIFISRPDLHLFDRTIAPNLSMRSEILNDPDMATILYMSPEIGLSLVNKWQTGAMTDINLFLSNRATAISFDNDATDDHQFVEGFNKITPVFGGRMDNPPGQLDIIFNETQDLGVSNTALMWMKYIHVTYTGKISPLIDVTALGGMGRTNDGSLPHFHPMWRRLDSLASIYIIATDMTQNNIIFWRKYFGVYPKNTAYAGLSKSQGVGLSEGSRTSSIPFRYTTFRTNNMIDLYAFNRLSNYSGILNRGYQIKDTNVTTDYHNIAGLPFVSIEQSIRSGMPNNYNNTIPRKMYIPHLMFAKSDGAFIPMEAVAFQDNFVSKYWGDLGGNAQKTATKLQVNKALT